MWCVSPGVSERFKAVTWTQCCSRWMTHSAAALRIYWGSSGTRSPGRLLLAWLYTLEEVRSVATQQKDACQHPFYISHRAALIIRSHNEAFAKAD